MVFKKCISGCFCSNYVCKRIYCRVNDIKFESADRALDALQDYGCLHFKTPIICGVSEPTYSPEELNRLNAENRKQIEIDGVSKTGYEWKQTMRRLETESRKTKDQIEILKSNGDNIGAEQLDYKLKAIKKKYNLIAKETGIKAQPERMAVIKSTKTVDKYSKSGIIKSENENSPRKQKSQNNSVNWKIVHSPEYKQRLSVITENEKVLSAIETRMKWTLNNRDGRDSEELYAISLSNGKEISKITNQYYYKAVKRTPQFTKKLNFADNQGESIILIHNHPDGLPPSVMDINNLLDNKNICGITAGHDGSIYYYTKPLKEIDIDDWTIAIKHFNKFSQVTAEEKALKILSKKYGFEFLKL